MRAPYFKTWFAQLPQLNLQQRQQALEALHPACGADRVIALITGIQDEQRRCPACGCVQYWRHGQANGLPRYRCRACNRTWNDLTGTPLARLRHKAKWLDYLAGMRDALSVRKAAQQVGVHRNTAFRWRHRFLDKPLSRHGIPLSG